MVSWNCLRAALRVLPRLTITLFTATVEEQQRLDRDATVMGAQLGDKNGGVYRLAHEIAAGLPADEMRVCNPRETELLGCADFVVTIHL